MTFFALSSQQVNLVRGQRANCVWQPLDTLGNPVDFEPGTTAQLTITTYLGPDEASVLHVYDDLVLTYQKFERIFEAEDIAALPIGAFLYSLSIMEPGGLYQPVIQGGFIVQMTVQGV